MFKVSLETRKANAGRSKAPAKKIPAIRAVSDLLTFVDQHSETDIILFRGQGADWPLLPKIARLISRDGDLLCLEKHVMKDFKRMSKPYLKRIPQNEWEWLAVAQHHGLATRLLDWTSNPLTALWFAVCRPAQDSADGVLWMYNVLDEQVLQPEEIENKSPYEGPIIKVFQPEISTVRIQAQNGWFTVHKYDEKKGNFIASSPIARHKSLPTKFHKFTIPYTSFGNIRDELDRLGVNELSLFQDIDGVANYVEWMHTLLKDELPEQKEKVKKLKSPAQFKWPDKKK